MCFSTTKSSASLDKAGVSEIGLKCLLMLETGFFLGIGVMSACFHARNSFCPFYEALSWCVIGSARTLAYSLRIQLPMLSGPGALDVLRFFNFFNTESVSAKLVLRFGYSWISSRRKTFHVSSGL